MAFVTLITDFGIRDGTVGVMKGVIWGIAPDAQFADLSHNIEPQNVRQAALVLAAHSFYFPKNTIHQVVVDPGVGTTRRPIAAQIGNQRFVGPDNGVFSLVLERAEREQWPIQIVHTDKPEFWLPKISDIFHGRDIFSPVTAHLAIDVLLEELGSPIDDPVRLLPPRFERTANGVVGEVIHIDHFGNVLSNIHRDQIESDEKAHVSLCGVTLEGIVRTFGLRQPGELIALYSSNDYLIVSVVNGSGAERIKAKVGDMVEVIQTG